MVEPHYLEDKGGGAHKYEGLRGREEGDRRGNQATKGIRNYAVK